MLFIVDIYSFEELHSQIERIGTMKLLSFSSIYLEQAKVEHR